MNICHIDTGLKIPIQILKISMLKPVKNGKYFLEQQKAKPALDAASKEVLPAEFCHLHLTKASSW